MKYEYLLFNVIVLSGPIIFGSLKKYYFWNYRKEAVLSILLSAIPFVLWDIAVTNRHWFFAESYTLGYKIFGLPIEEILFFITVPYACIFTWEMIHRFYNKTGTLNLNNNLMILLSIGIIVISLIALNLGKEYTALSLLFLLFSLLIDKLLGAKIIFSKIFWLYLPIVAIFTLIFNGYLTWRPIVTYNAQYQLDFRIWTIPIEDFLFGFALLIISTSIFEKLIDRNKNN